MEKLAECFKQKGFRFTQLERNNDYAVYLKENDVPIDSDSYYFSYEVIQIKKQKASTVSIGGKEINYPAKEVYPGDKSWGASGWTFRDGTEAKAYYITLTEKVPCSASIEVKTEDLRASLTL